MSRFSALLLSLVILLSVSINESVAQENQMFTNPILAGFYPDPSICRVGSDFFLVNSTFSYFPGIPVFQSRDLVNWKLIGHVMDRAEQMNLDGLSISRGIFAPAIRYNKGIFYVTCTLVDAGGNFIVTSENPAGPWSNPVWIPQINGIDPSMFFDDDGKAYIVYNSVAPNDEPLYEGHRTIRMYEFDIQNLKVINEEKILVNGGVDISKKPVWIEGPHIFKVNGYYYLMAAEGGTAEQHAEVIFRSRNVDGPYIPYEKNPILTQRHLKPDRNNPVTSTGHADLVQTEGGDWWAVFLGCRPYPPVEEGYYNTGRETFLAPVKWIDGWPVINPDYDEVQYFYPYPLQSQKDFAERPYSGNFKIIDEFDNHKLNSDWVFLRTPASRWYSLNERKGFISLELRSETCAGSKNPAFLGHRQQHLYCSAGTALEFNPHSENEKAGLLVFQNETHFYFLCKSLNRNDVVIQLYKSVENGNSPSGMELIKSVKIPEENRKNKLNLKIQADGNTYSFFFSFNDKWNVLGENIDASFLSTRVAGGFVGCMFALYAASLGEMSENKAFFDWFRYEGNDKVYQK